MKALTFITLIVATTATLSMAHVPTTRADRTSAVEKLLGASSSNGVYGMFIRPLLNHGLDAVEGLVEGLFNIDLDDPLFCINEAPSLKESADTLYNNYLNSGEDEATRDGDILYNYYDIVNTY